MTGSMGGAGRSRGRPDLIRRLLRARVQPVIAARALATYDQMVAGAAVRVHVTPSRVGRS